jgi:hypothetical protein
MHAICEEWVAKANFQQIGRALTLPKSKGEKRKRAEDVVATEDQGQFPEHVVMPCLAPNPELGGDTVVASKYFTSGKQRVNYLLIEYNGTPTDLETLAGHEIHKKTPSSRMPWGVVGHNDATARGVVLMGSDSLYTTHYKTISRATKKYFAVHGMTVTRIRKTRCKNERHGMGLNSCPLCYGKPCAASNHAPCAKDWAFQFEAECMRLKATSCFIVGTTPSSWSDGEWKGVMNLSNALAPWRPAHVVRVTPDWSLSLEKVAAVL